MPDEILTTDSIEQTTETPHSTGPRTPEGKSRSRLNATRHGLTSKVVIAPAEELDAYRAHCKQYFAEFEPVGIRESDLCQEIADDKFRLKRARSIENSLLALGYETHVDSILTEEPQVATCLAEGKAWMDNAKSLQLLTLYENRIHRRIERNTVELERLQGLRKQAHDAAQNEAVRLFHSPQNRPRRAPEPHRRRASAPRRLRKSSRRPQNYETNF